MFLLQKRSPNEGFPDWATFVLDRTSVTCLINRLRSHFQEPNVTENVGSTFSGIYTPQLQYWVSLLRSTPMKVELPVSSEMSALKAQTPGDYPKDTIRHAYRLFSQCTTGYRMIKQRKFQNNSEQYRLYLCSKST